ncbi:hypothetical protein BDB00DRAFT_872487 [Zychaea mexicana]|uniref:uncharacterized protein n=1 Tax=Zychaea mexicana TaxID=64656 RepID=UPI0022FDBE8F|nr:uncharacterized protein BDB00DRAFT_872487 [Zychaea mexicana]KAI9493387.1 hypothetical protein BDB00DRAFT_872487 [Zychaea mexicana]
MQGCVRANHRTRSILYSYHLLFRSIPSSPSEMKVLYFAAVRDITQVECDVIDVSTFTHAGAPRTLTMLTDHLVSKYGDKLRSIVDHAMYAVNMEYVDKDDEATTQLSPNDEVAIIPPVSGG